MHFQIREWAKTALWVLAVAIVVLAIILGIQEVKNPRQVPQVIDVDGYSQRIKLPNGQILTIEEPPPPAAPDKK